MDPGPMQRTPGDREHEGRGWQGAATPVRLDRPARWLMAACRVRPAAEDATRTNANRALAGEA